MEEQVWADVAVHDEQVRPAVAIVVADRDAAGHQAAVGDELVAIAVHVVEARGVGDVGEVPGRRRTPSSALATDAISSSTVTRRSRLRSAARQAAASMVPSVIPTAVTSSAMTTWASPLQSPMQAA
jgi:uncharacterized protein (DUF3084 family)